MGHNWEYVPFSKLFDWKEKSAIKSGDGNKNGRYKMYICSDVETKRYDTFLESGESLIFGTGGKASCHFTNEQFAYSTDCVVAQRKSEEIYTKFYYYYFRKNRLKELQETFTGSGLQHTSKKKIGNIAVPLLKLSEQQRIVSRIEELFSSLDNAVETLKKTKEQLAVYRQAVLKEAFEGEYTPNIHMRKIMIREIVDNKDGLRRGPFGSIIKKAFFVESGYKVYEQGNAINNDCNRGHYYISKEKYDELSSFHVKPGDYIVSCSGTIGRIAQLPPDAELGVINQALMRIRLKPNVIDPCYFMMQFRSDVFQSKILSRGTGMGNLASVNDFKKATMLLPDNYADQRLIVNEIESRLSVRDSIEQAVDTALARAEALRQSILKEAFEGRPA